MIITLTRLTEFNISTSIYTENILHYTKQSDSVMFNKPSNMKTKI